MQEISIFSDFFFLINSKHSYSDIYIREFFTDFQLACLTKNIQELFAEDVQSIYIHSQSCLNPVYEETVCTKRK